MAFWYGVLLHWRMNVRNKEFLIHYYMVPLVFYLFIGSVFTAIMPDIQSTLIQSMIVFGVTMGGVLGTPNAVVEIFGSEIKKAYQIGNIPLWSVILGITLSSIVHLLIVSSIVFVSAPFIFGSLLPTNLFAFLLGLFLMICASVGIGVVFGLYIQSASKIGMATQLVFLPSIMLSGIMFPISLLPNFLQTIGNILPSTLGYQIMVGGLSWNNVIGLLAILLLLVILANYKLKTTME